MENYNNMMNNDYNAMVYGGNMEQQHPMTSIPREMQIPQNQPMHQLPVQQQQSDIINLSYHQREIQMPHPNLPQQMGLFPTVASSLPPQIQHHNHILQQQHPVIAEQQQIPAVNIQYSIDDVNVSVNLDVQNNNDNFEPAIAKDPSINDDGAVIDPNSQLPTAGDVDGEQVQLENQSQEHPNAENKAEEISKKREPEVDPNQCRVCKSPDQLIDIFAIEEEMRICDIIMKICSSVRIHERDYLPHMICLGCLGRLRTAYQFVKEVQVTDKELRGKLKRSKSKVRKPSDGFVLIDCNEFSESEDDDLQNDDEEYTPRDEVEEEEEDTESGTGSDDSRKAKPHRKRGMRRSKSKKMKTELETTAKRLKRDIVFIEADNSDEDKEEKKKEKCKECGKIFSSKNNLRLHRKNAHFRSGEDAPFKCHICGRGFKYSINLTSHMQIHKESYSCDECGRVFASKSDVKKHALNQHKCSLSYECNKCRRLYCSVKRYQKHRESCSDYNSSAKKKMSSKVKEDFSFTGRDLFKTVAPVTTTYWSDSFSD